MLVLPFQSVVAPRPLFGVSHRFAQYLGHKCDKRRYYAQQKYVEHRIEVLNTDTHKALTVGIASGPLIKPTFVLSAY
jgi:hypothetical protein